MTLRMLGIDRSGFRWCPATHHPLALNQQDNSAVVGVKHLVPRPQVRENSVHTSLTMPTSSLTDKTNISSSSKLTLAMDALFVMTLPR